MHLSGQFHAKASQAQTPVSSAAKFATALCWLLLCTISATAELNATPNDATHQAMIAQLHAELGIPLDYEQRTGLPLQSPPQRLVEVGRDMFGRLQRLDADAARAWQKMVQAAKEDSVSLLLVSAFRPPEYQRDLLQRKLRAGETINQALRAVAAPGHSEHQSGRAVDVSCAGCAVLETEFEGTRTFDWLTENAAAFGFFLSYPRNNRNGIMYEPWHWCYEGAAQSPD